MVSRLCYAERLHVLLHRFKFWQRRLWRQAKRFVDVQMTQALDSATVTFDLQKYIHQLKPLNIEKAKKSTTQRQGHSERAEPVERFARWASLTCQPKRKPHPGSVCVPWLKAASASATGF